MPRTSQRGSPGGLRDSFLAILLVLAAAGSAQAQQQTYRLRAHATVDGPAGSGITVGEVLVGTFTYDASLLPPNGSDDSQTIVMTL